MASCTNAICTALLKSSGRTVSEASLALKDQHAKLVSEAKQIADKVEKPAKVIKRHEFPALVFRPFRPAEFPGLTCRQCLLVFAYFASQTSRHTAH
eukprot:1146340-Amphidinium_carterae.1